jgi:3-oxoacyl-[acyl-carrier-protein] synthase III
MMAKAKIIGTGAYAPERILTNQDLERMVETSDEWIRTRTGIVERHIARDDEDTSDMCVAAAAGAFESAHLTPADIDLIIVGTVTPDYRLPSTACVIQQKLGAVNAATMDVVAACAGFLHGLSIANAYVSGGLYRRVLVFGSEKLSSITNYEDRNTCVLFGDGAGAAIVAPSDDDSGIIATFLKSDGRLGDLLAISAGGTHMPFGRNGNNDPKLTYIRMNGNEIFKHAVRQMGDACMKVIEMGGITPEQVSLLIPHQANMRIIKATAERLKLPMEKVFLNIERYGNTSSASVPIALDEAVRAGKVKKGDYIIGVAFGGGLTWGAALIRW